MYETKLKKKGKHVNDPQHAQRERERQREWKTLTTPKQFLYSNFCTFIAPTNFDASIILIITRVSRTFTHCCVSLLLLLTVRGGLCGSINYHINKHNKVIFIHSLFIWFTWRAGAGKHHCASVNLIRTIIIIYFRIYSMEIKWDGKIHTPTHRWPTRNSRWAVSVAARKTMWRTKYIPWIVLFPEKERKSTVGKKSSAVTQWIECEIITTQEFDALYIVASSRVLASMAEEMRCDAKIGGK